MATDALPVKALLGIPVLKKVKAVISNDNFYIEVDGFFNVLEQHHGCSRTSLRKDNFVNYHNHQIRIIKEKKYCEIGGVLKFCYKNSDKVPGCKIICNQLHKLAFKITDFNTTLISLYNSLKNFNFGQGERILEWTFTHFSPPSNIPTLMICHKDYFNDDEWKRICYFEWHFWNTYPDYIVEKKGLDEIVEKKHDYFISLQDAIDVASILQTEANATKDRRLLRKKLSDPNEIWLFYSKNQKHVPKKIEQDVLSELTQYFPGSVTEILCMDCTHSCGDAVHGVHIYAEITEKSANRDMKYIQTLIESVCFKKHNLNCSSITMFQVGAFQNYLGDDDVTLHHFKLRDGILQGKLEDAVLCQLVPSKLYDVIDQACETCHGNADSPLSPLHWGSFCPIEDWVYDVPLVAKVLLSEPFINKRTIDQTPDFDSFFQGKIVRLYALYDTLLNTSNRKYCGVIQEMCTSELLMNYQSLEATLNMTHKMGLTVGESTADEHWNARANDDINYYNYAIRKYPLQYTTKAGLSNYLVSLRDCFNIATRDNLVTITERANPKPSESRHGQICTLQGTDIGIPRDSLVVLEIHQENGCEGESDDCSCNLPVKLHKDKVQETLLTLTSDEAAQVKKCRQLCVWGLGEVWHQVQQDEILSTLLQDPATQHLQPTQDFDNGVSNVTVLDESELDLRSLEEISVSEVYAEDEDQMFAIQAALYGIGKAPLEDLERSIQDVNEDLEISDFDTSLIEVVEIIHESIEASLDLTAESIYDVLETSHENHINTSDSDIEDIVQTSGEDPARLMGFYRYIPPPFLLRRTAPWIGRDDDPRVIKQVLEDFQTMTESQFRGSILGVDQKIGQCHIKLEHANPTFRSIVREIPVLHLLKMKILNFCSGYKDAGILLILKFMTDNQHQSNSNDIKHILGLANIRHAARIMQRLALALCLAFQVHFIRSLTDEDGEEIINDLQSDTVDNIANKWDLLFHDFIQTKIAENPTFALHNEMMNHAIEIVGINLAERIGGPKGYDLLRGCTKSSLLFSFLNGASSYAAYSTRLLSDHSSAPPIIQGIKRRFFSLPYEGSGVNFGLDTIREEEHRKAKKYFRPGADASTIGRRMQRVEEAIAMHAKFQKNILLKPEENVKEDHRNWNITNVDILNIIPAASLIVRRLDLVNDTKNPLNVYTEEPTILSRAMLDSDSNGCGEYLLYRYCSSERLFDVKKEDIQAKASSLHGPKELVDKVLKGASTTINRSKCKPILSMSTGKKAAQLRKKKIDQEKQRVESFSSVQNACQAIVNPSCSKYKVMKSLTVPRAIICAVGASIDTKPVNQALDEVKVSDMPRFKELCDSKGLIKIKSKHLHPDIAAKIKVVTVENAGSYYKAGKNVTTGDAFLREFEDRWITGTLLIAPNVDTIYICDEKYGFTPDLFKGATRSQRQICDPASIAHLKTGKEVISDATFSRASITKSSQGKKEISTYIARNHKKLSVNHNIQIVFDSEAHVVNDPNSQTKYTHPVKSIFTENGFHSSHIMKNIKQTKGEGECAAVDWVLHAAKDLKEGEAILSLVTSADIDAIVLHLFALSYHLPRKEDGKFVIDVYVALKKCDAMDIYCITGILQQLESTFQSQEIGAEIAMMLCIAGNDFLPKFQNHSHLKMLTLYLKDESFRDMLNCRQSTIDRDKFQEFVKKLYCPKSLDPDFLTYEELRQMTIKPPKHKKKSDAKPKNVVTFTFVDGQADLRHPRLWLPPAPCLNRLTTLYGAMMQYLNSLGKHDANLPDFSMTCLVHNPTTELYDLGPEAHVKKMEDLLLLDEDTLATQKRFAQCSSKRQLESTPMKDKTKRLRKMDISKV